MLGRAVQYQLPVPVSKEWGIKLNKRPEFGHNSLPAITLLRDFPGQKLASGVRALATTAALVVCVPKILAGS